MTADVRIEVDAREVERALDELSDDRKVNADIAKGAKKAAVFLAQKTRPLAPRRKKGKRKPGAKPLHRTISARGAKRDKPGAVVVVRAPHRHLVIRGTAERFHKSTGKSTGIMPADPFVDRAADEYEKSALDKAIAEIADQIGLD